MYTCMLVFVSVTMKQLYNVPHQKSSTKVNSGNSSDVKSNCDKRTNKVKFKYTKDYWLSLADNDIKTVTHTVKYTMPVLYRNQSQLHDESHSNHSKTDNQLHFAHNFHSYFPKSFLAAAHSILNGTVLLLLLLLLGEY